MIVGIDLGTTNSLIGSFEDGKSVLFPNASGRVLTPSVVSYGEEGIIVGDAAKDRLISHPEMSVAAFKRHMGTARETRLGDQTFRAEELSSFVLRSLIADAEAATGRRPTEAIISVPAYFSDGQRQATRLAGEMAGLKVDRLINEPTAAALAYGLQQRDTDSRFLVFDLGGGTFDVSIVEIFDNVVEVHASAGDNFLGGEDFVDILMTAAARDLSLDLETTPKLERLKLRRHMERIKLELSSAEDAVLNAQIAGRDLAWSVTRGRFEELSQQLVTRLRKPLERALSDAKLQPSDLNEIVLVGGASRMPLVVRTLTKLFGRLPLRTVNPDEVVGHGAAVAAGLKLRDASLEEVILTDVCPYTLGTAVSREDGRGSITSGYYLPLIDRNSTVPISREQELWPVHPEQDYITVEVYQGERPHAEDNILLGSLRVPLGKAGPQSDRGVLVRFTYDIEGILQVEAKVKATAETYELVIERGPTALSPQALKDRLKALEAIKVHPREKQENLALIARAERLYEENIEHREPLLQMLIAFRGVLDGQDERQIARLRSQISADLDRIDRL